MSEIKKYSDLRKIIPFCCGCKAPNNGDLYLAHRNRGGWGLLFGRGIKSLSVTGSFLCPECHLYGDGDGRRDADWWELATQRAETWAWREGYLQFRPAGGDADQALR